MSEDPEKARRLTAPLVRLLPPYERSTISVTRAPSGTHDVSAGGLAVARVTPDGAQSSDEHWRFARRRHGRSWRGVAETTGFNEAVAASTTPSGSAPAASSAIWVILLEQEMPQGGGAGA